MMYAYFDESEIGGGPCPVMGVAGFLYEESRARELDGKLKELYETYRIPDFHSAPCEAGDPPFDKLERQLRLNLRNKIIDYIHQYSAFGASRCLPLNAYRQVAASVNKPMLTPYEICAWVCVGAVIAWVGRTGYSGRVTYIFESGAKHQAELKQVMEIIYRDPALRDNHVYASHAFAGKGLHRPLHTADLFAWEATHAAVVGFTNKGFTRHEYARLVTRMPCEHTLMGISELQGLAPMLRWMRENQPAA